jgi:peptidoglycan/xylan/chitin deacetylase (PgdA/CDA1 family)
MPWLERSTLTLSFSAIAWALASGCHAESNVNASVLAAPSPPSMASAPRDAQSIATPRAPIDGHDFPDGVLALTWDDGPDQNTLKLAELLREARVSATFFVVGEWIDDLSQDPGWGRGIFETGHDFIPVLGDLVGLGHRIGNHTLHHVLLSAARPKELREEISGNQDRIAPFLTNELPLFRAPGGAWDKRASDVLDGDPALSRIIGPISWDVDEKDWENAVYNLCEHPRDCEDGPHGPRVKATVTAKAYLDTIARRGHGIVLMHDRVGDVGSTYALDVARVLVPALIARGFVFAAPVLRFSPLTARMRANAWTDVDPESLVLTDVDGDGRADACIRAAGRVVCAVSEVEHDDSDAPHVVFRAPRGRVREVMIDDEHPRADPTRWGDLNGDGRMDECFADGHSVSCALRGPAGLLRATVWLDEPVQSFALGDVNGDGRDDLCTMTREGLACAISP